MFKVLSEFADLQDGNHIYSKGDEYPRKGYSPSKERVESLLSGNNLLHTKLIQMVESEPVVETVEEKSEPVVEAVEEEPKKRGRKKK